MCGTTPTIDHQCPRKATIPIDRHLPPCYTYPVEGNPNSMQIFISGPSGRLYEFAITEKYKAGQTLLLSRAEARVLNQLRAENVAKNKSRLVRRLELEQEDGLLTDPQLAKVQKEIDDYDGRYSFSESIEPQARQGDIEREAIVAAKILNLAPDHPNCRHEARRRLLATRGLAKKALEAL